MKSTWGLIPLLLLLAESAAASPLYDTPVYDPSSKSYFALIDGTKRQTRYHTGYVWSEAFEEAQTRLFHGVRGRLATIRSVETYEFLLTTFKSDTDTWIGYRYMCQSRQLLNSTGLSLSKASFQAWDTEWKQDEFACAVNKFTHDYGTTDTPSAKAYAPIAIQPAAKGFRWFAKGPGKGYTAYLIEWPTGGP